ncbi:MAG: NACHT domain-containing protein, partial [Gammaproteobacteria bacterium]
MEADEGRADLYERAVELLLARWENRLVRKESGQCTVDPGLIQRLGLRMDVVRGALGRVAFAAHERQGSDRGSSDRAADIPREDLREELGRELGSVDRADQVIAYIRDRAGLLHQLDNRTYAFAHRTFQEYLAARHLLSAAEPAAELGKRVRKDLTWWREVFLLAAGSAKRTTPSVITNLVNDLLPGPPPGNAVSSKKAEEAGLAGQALVETDFIDHVRREAEDRMPEDGPGSYASCLDKVQQWLLASLCADPTVAARERARAGATLAPLGDPRREVLDPDEMQFSLVHEVEVWLGSGDDDEMAFDDEKTKRKPRRYALGYGYWMARFPVTNAQFEHFVKDKGYGEARARYWIEAQAAGVWSGGEVEGRFDDLPRTAPSDYRSSFTLQNHPVVGITWYEALAIRAGSPSAGGRRGSSVRTRRSRCPPSPSGRRRRGGARDH